MKTLKSHIEAKLKSVGPLSDATAYALAVINPAVCQHEHGMPRVESSEIASALSEYAEGYSLWVSPRGSFSTPYRIVSIGRPAGHYDAIPFAG